MKISKREKQTSLEGAAIFKTRRQRRKALAGLIYVLQAIKEGEEACRDNTPENLQNSSNYEDTEIYIECLDEALEILRYTY